MSLLGIAIVNYLGAEDTGALVHSIVARNGVHGSPLAIAIVDNSDQRAQLEPVVAFATASGVTATLIQGHGNVGYAAGNNLAADWLLPLGVAAIWVLNPDTRITGGSLEILHGTKRIVCIYKSNFQADDSRENP